ncbi:MAG: nucleoside triphosphate pyrophosphohydrolase [Alphaproteobacteria bacterium]|nr:nucleoside triphosphate pyrophosphohydrolase [Alphaproteobacteria bacterium]
MKNPADDNNNKTAISRLLAVMAALRTPQTGCPWDLQQDFASIAPYTLEEAYEVVDAIERGDMGDLQEELGDLLLQVVFHGQMAKEAGLFTFDDIAQTVTDKMIRRHPHVFDESHVVDNSQAKTAAKVKQNWEAIKEAEKADKDNNKTASLVDNVPLALPGLTRAVKLQKRAARVGFDWTQAAPILAKIKEEIAELEEVINENDNNNNDKGDASNQPQTARLEEEYGDILFALANLARHLRFDPETAIRAANQKFMNRFKWMENKAKQEGKDLASMSLEDMEILWQQAKIEV